MCLLLLMKDGLLKLREMTPTVYAGVILPSLCNSLGVKSLEELIQICLHSLPYPQVPQLMIQPAMNQKYLEKNSRKHPRSKLEFATH